MTRYGLHISTLGNPPKAIKAAADAGLEAVQFFPGNPKSFWPSTKEWPDLSGHCDLIVHATYTINPASPVPNKTVPGAVKQVKYAKMLGAKYIIFHAGSTKEEPHWTGVDAWYEALDQMVEAADGKVTVLIENMAQGRPWNTKGSMGRLETLCHLMEPYSPDQVAICLDTAHAWGCGEKMASLATFYKTNWIPVIHANIPDLDVSFGSRRDRHSVTLLEAVAERQYTGLTLHPLLLAQMVHSLNPEIVILESMRNTMADANYLRDTVAAIEKGEV